MADQDGQLPVDVREALRRGNVIEAIKRLRESTGMGLKEAKDAVDAHLSGRSANAAANAPARPLSAPVVAAMQRGDKIEAIKLLREETGFGLKEAKDAIEAAQGESGLSADSRHSTGEVPRSGNALWWLVAIAAAVVGAYFLLGKPH